MPDVEINLQDLQAEVDKLSPEKLKEDLLKFRVRQKVQQKKHQGSDKQKAYQQKQREKFKLLKAKAQAMGIYDAVNDEAEKLAEEKLAEAAADNEE